jgi:H+/Cl- antiporter ClcA
MSPAPSRSKRILRRFLGRNSIRLRRRVSYLVGGLGVGLLAILMAFLADKAQLVFSLLVERYSFAPMLVTPAGFAFAVWLTTAFFPQAQGSGIPQVIAARQSQLADERSRLVSLRNTLGKICVMTFGLMIGASTGREGPTVQVGASIMLLMKKYAKGREQDLLLAGAAAGVAAAFNTPLAGIVFAIEELGRSFETKASGLLIGAVIAAGFTSLAIQGDYTYFGTSSAFFTGTDCWLAAAFIAVISGLCGGQFGHILCYFPFTQQLTIRRALSDHKIAFAALCGFGVALCGWLSADNIFGTGYVVAKALVEGSTVGGFMFPVFKFVATILSSLSGIPGGIFAPSLSIGAGIGADFHMLFPNVSVSILAILGMCAFLSGVVQAPITSFVIVIEMTNDHALAIPLMAVSLVATLISRRIMREGLYHVLSKRFSGAPSS